MNKNLKTAIIVVGLLILVWVSLTYVLPLIVPFVIAAIFAALLDPLATGLTNKLKVPRTISSVIVILIACLVFGLLVSFAVTEIVVEIDELSRSLATVDRTFADVVQDIINWGTDLFDKIPTPITDLITVNQDKITDLLVWIVDLFSSIIRTLPQIAIVSMIGAISMFFMIKDKEVISNFINNAYDGKYKAKYLEVKKELSDSFVGYLKAQLIMMMITMALTIITLSILGVKYAWLIGIACGILDLIPLIGPSLLYIPWIGYLLIAGNPVFALKLLITFFATSMIREFTSAKIVGNRLRLHPLIVIMSVYVGLQIFGAMGFLIGPLFVILVRSIYKAYLGAKETEDVVVDEEQIG